MKAGVILPQVTFDPGGFSVLGDAIMLQRLQHALLYWENVSTPLASTTYTDRYINTVQQLSTSGLVELVDLDIFPNGVISFDNKNFQPIINYFVELRSRESESWGLLSDGEYGDPLPHTVNALEQLKSSRQKSIHLSLARALPLPTADTSIDDIVKFREDRKDLLEELHHALNKLSSEYANLSDEEEPLILAHLALDNAMSEYATTIKERMAIGSFKLLRYGVAVGLVGVGAASQSVPGLFIGVALQQFVDGKIKSISTKLPKSPQSGPYAYAFVAQKDLS
jgi:hypothetical protein